jgi:hypothetical protein
VVYRGCICPEAMVYVVVAGMVGNIKICKMVNVSRTTKKVRRWSTSAGAGKVPARDYSSIKCAGSSGSLQRSRYAGTITGWKVRYASILVQGLTLFFMCFEYGPPCQLRMFVERSFIVTRQQVLISIDLSMWYESRRVDDARQVWMVLL